MNWTNLFSKKDPVANAWKSLIQKFGQKPSEINTTFGSTDPSYYIPRKNRSMQKQDFEIGGTPLDPNFAKCLSHELGESMIGSHAVFIELACKLRNVPDFENQDQELSPFVYTMF